MEFELITTTGPISPPLKKLAQLHAAPSVVVSARINVSAP